MNLALLDRRNNDKCRAKWEEGNMWVREWSHLLISTKENNFIVDEHNITLQFDCEKKLLMTRNLLTDV